jgi:hypothetical protein
MAAQSGVAWDEVERLLGAAGFGPDAATRVVEYLTADELAAYEDAVEARAARLGANQPPVATVAVERLLRPGVLIEVEVTASGARRHEGLVHLGSLTSPRGRRRPVGAPRKCVPVWGRRRSTWRPSRSGGPRSATSPSLWATPTRCRSTISSPAPTGGRVSSHRRR